MLGCVGSPSPAGTSPPSAASPVFAEASIAQPSPSSAAHAPPPYSCTRDRAFHGAGSTVIDSPPASAGPGVRTTAWRPPSEAMPSVHQSWSPTNCGPPRRVPPCAIDAALIGEGQDPYARVPTMAPG